MAKSSRTIQLFLSFCDPRCKPVIDNPDDVLGILKVAEKYEADTVGDELERSCRDLRHQSPSKSSQSLVAIT